MIVPTLPGSRPWASTTIVSPTLGSGSSREIASSEATAQIPWESPDRAAETSAVTGCTQRVTRRAASTTSAWVSHASCRTYTSRTHSPRCVTSSRTACGPSTSIRPERERAERPTRPDTLRTRSARGLSRTVRRSAEELTYQALGALMSAGSASLATFTRALNALMSLTASSASMRRSTSTPARFRPWIRRL